MNTLLKYCEVSKHGLGSNLQEWGLLFYPIFITHFSCLKLFLISDCLVMDSTCQSTLRLSRALQLIPVSGTDVVYDSLGQGSFEMEIVLYFCFLSLPAEWISICDDLRRRVGDGAVLFLALQLCPTLCDPMDCSLLGSSVHGDSPGKNTEVGCCALRSGSSPPGDWTLVSYISCIGKVGSLPLCCLADDGITSNILDPWMTLWSRMPYPTNQNHLHRSLYHWKINICCTKELKCGCWLVKTSVTLLNTTKAHFARGSRKRRHSFTSHC